jgi:hypothetical protein
MKKGLLQRGIVLFLLIFALADLTSGNPCGDEIGAIPPEFVDTCNLESAAATPACRPSAETALAPADGPAQHSQNHEEACEDCFCCCSHILPSANFNHPALLFDLQIRDLKQLVLPAAPPRDRYRPPRHL